MANKVALVVCLLIVAVDVVAGTFGIKAEIAQNKRNYGCKKAREEAFKFGFAATALQALAHILANLLGGCMCIFCTEELERSTANRQLWFASLITSWLVVAVGFPMLIIGMLENSKSRGGGGRGGSSSSSSCPQKLHNHLMLMGGLLCFLHGLFCIALYVSSTFGFRHQSTVIRHPLDLL